MKVGLNLFPLERAKWSGIEIYTYELIKFLCSQNLLVEGYSMAKLDEKVKLNEFIYKSFEKNDSGSLRKLMFNLYTINKLVENVDVFHSTMFSLPFGLKAKKKIITIHDFAFFKLPELFDYKTKLFYKLTLDYSIQSADRIICISNSCLEDFKMYYPKKELIHKTRLVYNGYNDFSKRQVSGDFAAKFGEFLLCVGASHKRKNLQRILEAFATIVVRKPNLKLLITGSFDVNSILNPMLKTNPELLDKVVHLSYIEESKLIELYQNAKLLMFPSLYEGFGFPILEAMGCGTPVLTSLTSSCGEIADYDKKFLVNPYSVEDIVEKTNLILDDSNYNQIVLAGIERANAFSWQKMGEETLNVYLD